MLCHDPRISNDRNDKRETTNPALMITEVARSRFPTARVDWERVVDNADHLDLLLIKAWTGVSG
jgi:hypothetical protein